MSLWKRDRIYESHVWVDGVRYRKSTGTSNRRLAEQIDQKFKEELIARRNQVPNFAPDMTFGELAAKFLSDGAVKAWHVDRLKILLPYFSESRMAHIGRKAVADFRKFRHEQRKLTESTINRDIECLRHILYWAIDEGFLTANPLARVRLERERRRKRPVLALAEEAPLLEAASPHLRAIVITALDTGMRRSEILNQRWEDVDFPRRLLSVTKSKTPEGEAREIPLTERVFRRADLHLQRQAHPPDQDRLEGCHPPGGDSIPALPLPQTHLQYAPDGGRGSTRSAYGFDGPRPRRYARGL